MKATCPVDLVLLMCPTSDGGCTVCAGVFRVFGQLLACPLLHAVLSLHWSRYVLLLWALLVVVLSCPLHCGWRRCAASSDDAHLLVPRWLSMMSSGLWLRLASVFGLLFSQPAFWQFWLDHHLL